MTVKSLVIKVLTVDGQEYNVRVYLQAGADAEAYRRIPTELAAGAWIDEKTFIPGTAIVRAEIVVGRGVKFPE